MTSNRFKEYSEDAGEYYLRIGTGERGSSVYFTESYDDYPMEDEEMADVIVAKLTAKGKNAVKRLHIGTWYVRVFDTVCGL